MAYLDGKPRTPDLDQPDPACSCGHIACVCAIKAAHTNPKCRFRLAATGPVGIECEHGYDVCPTCDPCTCVPPVNPPF